MLRGLVAEVKAQEFAQTQAIGQPPGDPSFATDALAVAKQKSSEIDVWCDARPTLDRLAKALTKLLDLEVELALCQNLVYLGVERVRRWLVIFSVVTHNSLCLDSRRPIAIPI